MSMPIFGILQWTKEEIERINVKTRQILCPSGSFHVNSDVDSHRKSGGHGSVTYIIQESNLFPGIPKNKPFRMNSMVLYHEKEASVRVADEQINVLGIEITETSTPKELSEKSKSR